jgi:hypothetical protein
MDRPGSYHVTRPVPGCRQVEAWSGYPLQFAGQRPFAWQDQMAVQLQVALAELAILPGESLAGMYLSTDDSLCDAENRLFTNPREAIPKRVTSITFERGWAPPPQPPVPVSSVKGHVYYYRYRSGAAWEWWEPDQTLARWHRVPRVLPDDGSGRPYWLAMKLAAAAGQIETIGSLDDTTPFGLRLVVHARARGPRSAPAICEMLIDGTVAAFHAGAGNAAVVAAALAPRMADMAPGDIEALVTMNSPGPFFGTSPFVVKDLFVQINPSDERCYAGQVTIRPDAQSQSVEISGELFTLRRARA